MAKIFLIGYMGSGKSSSGKVISPSLNEIMYLGTREVYLSMKEESLNIPESKRAD